jgi:hypothetical protein
VIDPDPNGDGNGSDAAVVGRTVLANGGPGAGVTDGTGGQGNKPLPMTHDGELEDTFASDNARLELKPSSHGPRRNKFTGKFIEVEFEATAPADDPDELTFLLEASANRRDVGAVAQAIKLFNFTNGVFEVFDARNATPGDSTVSVPVPDPARFIDPATAHMRARIQWERAGAGGFVKWTAAIDHLAWLVGQ